MGSIAVQLARRAGATVIGLASEPNRTWLSAHAIIPVTGRDGVTGRIRSAAAKAAAFIGTSAAIRRACPQ